MSDLTPCESDLYKNGINAGVYDTSYMGAEGFEKAVRATAELTGLECDWHYFGGRAVLKAHEEDWKTVRNAFEVLYTYLYNVEGPEWCKRANMEAHFRKREPDYV
jgi:hypothetical protein